MRPPRTFPGDSHTLKWSLDPLMRKSRWIVLISLPVLLTLAFVLYRQLGDYLPRIPSSPDEVSHITFYALGDQGKANEAQQAVANAMEQQAEQEGGMDFVLLLGDNFYNEDKLTTQSPAWMSAFEKVYTGKYLDAVPFYAVLGNHDYPDSVQAELDYARRHLGSNRWRMPARDYSEDFGRVDQRPLLRIVFLDTNQDPRGQAEYLRKQFAAGGNPIWKIAVGHHPLRTYGKHHQDEQATVDNALLSAMQQSGVDLYIAAHDHNQQLIVREGEPLQIVTGAGGAKLYDLKSPGSDMHFGKAEHGFLRVALDASSLNFSFIDSQAKTRASYHWDRSCVAGLADCLESAPQ